MDGVFKQRDALLSPSQAPPPRGPRQREPHPHPPQQLPGPEGLGDGRGPEAGPLPLGPGLPEPCSGGESTHHRLQEAVMLIQNDDNPECHKKNKKAELKQ